MRNCIVNSLMVVNPNRFAASGGNAITVAGGATDFSFTGGCLGASAADSKATGPDGLSIGAGCASFVVSGVSMRGVRYGLNLAVGSDYYSVTGNLFEGGTRSAFVGLDSNASTNRRVHDNSGLGYSGVMTGSPVHRSAERGDLVEHHTVRARHLHRRRQGRRSEPQR